MTRVGEVMDVFDQCAVTVKKNSRAKLPCPGTASCEDPNGIPAGSLERFVSADIQVITTPDPSPHSPHKAGQHVESEVECVECGDLAISAGFDHVHARIGKVTGGLLGLLDE